MFVDVAKIRLCIEMASVGGLLIQFNGTEGRQREKEMIGEM
jgi:hypothetical protein